MSITYTIDGSAVTLKRADSRLFPGAALSRREDGFPGDATIFVLKSAAKPPTLVVEGDLQETHATLATAITNLRTAIFEQEVMAGGTSTHTVVVHADTYSDMELKRFETLGPMQPVAGSTHGVQQRCRWVWQQLDRSGITDQ